MKISELISELKKMKKLHSDIEVEIASEPGEYPSRPIFELELEHFVSVSNKEEKEKIVIYSP